ncbi:substrate-binding domain-containing protein [Kaistia dalseonensis]|uniref:Simple sugar transport system substrate-binding protein n=1 Tax=Kaistia dalseonensis TaxID=410840 RepID=A0ABU0HC97_9HYPH|nr:substrate-binding domain-containing protein [Kaistia dalseonensis]MCX5496765.1 substrate-binding domain-containing protein [Kaistia dalseonensis]MDQ0439390.1 simple sugar transport system substrate-binding protein [Kaistia dalseonensis]
MKTTFLSLALAAGLTALASGASAEGLAGAPAPFDKGGVKIAVVSFLGSGDWLQAFEAGVKRQAEALGIEANISQARNDINQERELIQQAINLGVKGIIINNGQPEALKDVAQAAIDAGIPVVAYDVNIDNPKIPQIEQSDADMARLVLEQAIKDQGETFDGGVVYVAGFAPLDRRYAVWKDFQKKYPGIKEIATWGVVNDTVAASVADQTKAVLAANPSLKVVFTPWDEFARGVKLAIDEAGVADKVKIYGVDISTSDIQAMREPNSPWLATAATNPAVVGEVSVRALAQLIAGEDPGHSVLIQPTLVTQKTLIDNDIKTIEELQAKFPAFKDSDAAKKDWIPAAK